EAIAAAAILAGKDGEVLALLYGMEDAAPEALAEMMMPRAKPLPPPPFWRARTVKCWPCCTAWKMLRRKHWP
ncbi:hypothetical protein, partial [Aquitalea magnusonii]|uniref:hypothetical protein n=1 Tax=Aquitalea magnusonii TaxID=332411 RepID=UPI00137943FC